MLTPAAQKTRSQGVGSSEIAMLIYMPDENDDPKPLSPWGGRHLLWRRKTGREEEADAKSYMTRGQFMEKGLIDWYAHDNSVDWKKPRTVRNKDYPYVVDSCDGLTYPKGEKGKVLPLRCIEAKMTSTWAADKWGEPGTDEVPNYYLVQCQWHLGNHETQEQICDVPMDNGTKRNDYHIAFDEELYLSLVSEAEKFWMDYVQADKEPPVDDHHDATKWLSKYLAHKDGMGFLEASDEQVQLMLQYREVAVQVNDGASALEELKEKLQRAIGEYDGIIVPGTKAKITWKPSKDTMGIDWQEVAKALADQLIGAGALDAARFLKLQDDHKKVMRKGSRRWTPTALLKNPVTATP